MRVARLDRLVREQARVSPGAIAIDAPDGHWTYAELDAAADGVAHALARLGVRRGDRVVLWLPKSARAIAAMQGVLRLGAAYVPVDPLAPADRAALLVADCAPRAVVTDPGRAPQLTAAGVRVPLLTGRTGPAGPVPDVPGRREDDLAYILYTSGTTGTPKGVCLSHRNALAFTTWAAAELRATPGDRFANHAPFHSDLSVLDLYVAFAAGASVHLVPDEAAFAPRRLVEYVTGRRITVWYSVPSALVLMVREGGLADAGPAALRAVLFAGEPFPPGPLRRLRAALPDARLLNLYGPTETNVCTFHEVTVVDGPVPLGRACCGDRVRALRPDGTEAAPGEPGELVVDGPTVMLGYWGRPPRRGPFATGDRAVLRDGVYHYLGRDDARVKLRGNRIEPGEIEAVLASCPGVAEVAVVVTGTGADARLVAHVVPEGERGPGPLEIRRHCAPVLPPAMIPGDVRHVRALPRTCTGKTDRGRLAAS
ncbi:amino acid adenylation domain-containing protein [Actinomadura rayongensis]|uniref:Amino acid adenylation domain-containing protein n=1 Tax=Actinomadura rayongensis TaxID=1429076 RepID=A0A6I4W9E7_9ACTN|nr:amino acid adenylation domain-containing protein [Actinomadura rayongensis]MXQ64706.1 amino acid adenylation domain-containing protein [Actinomadura rayongensis]